MPGPKGVEKGQRSDYQVRYTAGGPCVGVYKTKDISTVSDQALVEGINCRIQDGVVTNRGGQSALLEEGQELTGCVTGLIDLQGAGVNLLLNPAGQLDTYVGFLAAADRYERLTLEILSSSLLRVHPTDETKGRYSFAHWRGNVVLFASTAESSDIWVLYKLIPPEVGNEATDIQIEEVFRLPEDIKPSSLVVFPASQGSGQSPELEPIFVGTQGGGVYGFDGIEVKELLAEAEFESRVVVFRYHDMLYAAGAQAIKRWLSWTRGTGSPLLGTWDDVALPTDTFPDGISDFSPLCATEYLDYALVGGTDLDVTASSGNPGPACILKLAEDSAGDVVCTVEHAVTNAEFVYDITVFNGTAIYASSWESSFATSPARLGGWDGNTWEEELGSLFSENEAVVFRLFSTGDRLYMGATCNNDTVESNEPAGLFEVTPDSLVPLSTLTITRLVDTTDLLSDSEGASDIVAW